MDKWKQYEPVFTIKYGNGGISAIKPNDRRPIKVIFEGGIGVAFTGRETDPDEKLYHGAMVGEFA